MHVRADVHVVPAAEAGAIRSIVEKCVALVAVDNAESLEIPIGRIPTAMSGA